MRQEGQMNTPKHQSIDEGMVKYKGRCFARQYMPNKSVKIGLRIFMRCEAEGYCYDYWLNMGNHDLFHGRSIGEKVVKHLCRPLKYKCHYFFFWQILYIHFLGWNSSSQWYIQLWDYKVWLGRRSSRVKKSWSKRRGDLTDATWPTTANSLERQENEHLIKTFDWKQDMTCWISGWKWPSSWLEATEIESVVMQHRKL